MGVEKTAEQAASTAKRILTTIFDRDRLLCESVGRSAGTVLRIHHHLRRNLIFTQSSVVRDLKMTFPTVSSGIRTLERLGLAREVTGRERDRIYTYTEYLALLNEGTELPKAGIEESRAGAASLPDPY